MTSKEEVKIREGRLHNRKIKDLRSGRNSRRRSQDIERTCSARNCSELKNTTKMSVTQTSSEDMFPHRGYPSTSGDSHQRRRSLQDKRMYVVDSDASLHMMGQAKCWIFKPRTLLRCQYKSLHQSLVHFRGYIWWKMLCQCCRREDHATSLLVLIRGQQEGTPRFSGGKRFVACTIENVVSVFAVTKQKLGSIHGHFDWQRNLE